MIAWVLNKSGMRILVIDKIIDDREKNVVAARNLGIDTILFKPEPGFGDVKNRISRRGHD